jgi:hypothetical protein
MTDDFIKKLMISKQIMDKHKEMPRTGQGGVSTYINESSLSTPELYSADPIPASYNIPQEFLSSEKSVSVNQTPVTEDRIQKSKLPDAIKKLMIEHPIEKPQQHSPTISNDIIERAARLMSENKEITQQSNKTTSKPQSQNFNNSDLKKMMRETIEEVLRENGLIVESTNKSQDLFTFKVGKHLFEGKISKIKKLS